jgi:hypothetical protein
MLPRSSMRTDTRVYPCFARSERTSPNRELPGSGRAEVGVVSCIDLVAMGTRAADYEVLAQRRCLVCDLEGVGWESEREDEIGRACSTCHAPTERWAILERRRILTGVNPHAAALGRLGGLKGGHARAAKLTASRRRAIARIAARARWMGRRGVTKG